MPADFLSSAKGKMPTKLLTDWVPKLGLTGGFALDLGCGTGAEAEWLAKQGFTVDAIDKSEAMIAAARVRCDGLKVNTIAGDFTAFNLECDRYSLATAINSLPFVAKEKCRMLLEDVKESIKPGGAVVLAVYGTEHSWASRTDMSFWTLQEFADVWADFNVLALDEFKGPWPLMSGEEVFQHRIHIVAKKPNL